MRQLSKVENAIFLLGGLLMVVGAGTSLLAWGGAPYVFAFGALCFAAMQMKQRYDGKNVTIRRLRRMMLISDVLFLAQESSPTPQFKIINSLALSFLYSPALKSIHDYCMDLTMV